ncbi:MAG: DNA recombination protein RmuC, partial [Candidatus Shapirobacteria bacterium]
MEWKVLVLIAGALIVGFGLGLVAAFILRIIQTKTAKELAAELFQESEEKRKESIENIKAIFGQLSLDALSKSTDEFLKLAKVTLTSEREMSVQELETKKGLIDQQLKQMNTALENVATLMRGLEKDRVEKFGELSTQLKETSKQTTFLAQTTTALHEVLSATKTRGQWGERMAEDVLQVAGFIENVNYLKQKMIGEVGTRPDYTFLLPGELKLNMDVKFPLNNYLRFIEAETEVEKEKFRLDFMKDVKARIKEVTTRDYINPEQNTLYFVIMFIPNEQIYTFVYQQQDSIIFDEGMKNKVVICSPINLFAVLVVIRQAIDNFALGQKANEMRSLFGAFKNQWEKFTLALEQVGKRIEAAQKEYEALITTRRRQLERPLNKIETLRTQR